MSHIFISYSKKDIDFARRLRSLLQAQGFAVWMDETRLAPSARWWATIEQNIINASAVIVVMSPNAKESEWVERELLVAEDPEHRKTIFPVLLAGKVWSRLANIQFTPLPPDISTLPPDFLLAIRQVVPPTLNTMATVPRGLRIAPVQSPAAKQLINRKPARSFLWLGLGGGVVGLAAVAAVVFLVVLPGIDRNTRTITPTNGRFADALTATSPADVTLTAAAPTETAIVINPIAPVTMTPITNADTNCRIRVATNELNVRSGPAVNYDVVGKLTRDQEILVIGRTADLAWYQVDGYGYVGWVNNAFVVLLGDCLSVSVANIPPSPTVPPTAVQLHTPVMIADANLAAYNSRIDPYGVAQVRVPAGCFEMGSDEHDTEEDERPIHDVCITQPFWIDAYEVTNASFEQFRAAGGYLNDAYWYGDSFTLLQSGTLLPRPSRAGFDGSLQPRVNVSWYEAAAYAAWRGCRLPTEAEWEYAARGPEGKFYPWGDTDDAERDLANTAEVGESTTVVVGSYANSASWIGAYDMAGNVFEWVADWYDKDYYAQSPTDNPTGPATGELRGLRGGSFQQGIDAAHGSDRYWAPPDGQAEFVGFRAVCPA